IESVCGKRRVDLGIARSIPVREEDQSRPPAARSPGDQELIAFPVEAVDEAGDQGIVVNRNALEPDIQQMLDGGRPRLEVEEIRGPEHVEGSHAEPLAEFGIRRLLSEILGRLHREPIGLLWSQSIAQFRPEPAEAGAVRAAEPLETYTSEGVHLRSRQVDGAGSQRL